MPFGDRTGPAWTGPRSGRGMGYCAGFGVSGSANRTGCSFRGRGRGWRNWFYATGLTGWQRAALDWPAWARRPPAVAPEDEMESLKSQASLLERALETIRKRIEELSAGPGSG